MKTQLKHTPGKWSFSKKKDMILDNDKNRIANLFDKGEYFKPYDETQANAQRIIKAVNMHDELIEMIKELKYELRLAQSDNFIIDTETKIERAEELLKKAEQE